MKKSDVYLQNIYQKFKKIYDEDLPLSNYSFSLLLFIDKLVDESIADGITDLFFLSREGSFLKLLYDKYVSVLNISNCPKSHYLYVSRKAMANGTLSSIDKEDFNSFRVYSSMSIAKFCKALDFSEEEINQIALKFESVMDIEYLDFFDNCVFDELKNSLDFRTAYEKKRVQNNGNCWRYFENSGFAVASKPALVDVGWNGTIQNCIFKMNMHPRLTGYYIGCRKSAKMCENNVKKGLLFNGESKFELFSHFNYNYEYVCVANHGAVVRYAEFGPVLEDDGDVDLFNKIYGSVQDNILGKFSAMLSILNEKNVDEYVQKCVYYYHIRFLNHLDSREKEIIALSKSEHPDNFVEIKPIRTLKVCLYAAISHVVMKYQELRCWMNLVKL